MALSLYIHIPFCIHKCSYCDFFSLGVGQSEIPAASYMERVGEELRVMVTEFGLAGRALVSIFFGGGTPSMIPPALLGTFLEEVGRHFALPDGLEITCEANPETLDRKCLAGLLAAGINRLSVGVQSFQARHLQFLERVHSAQRAEIAVQTAHDVGFTNINLDLIFGLPDQTMNELHNDLTRALALQTQHISAYQLTVEPRTPLAVQVDRGACVPIDDERAFQMWQTVQGQLSSAGFPAYEVSNYAQANRACRHNMHYWRYGEYLGVGTGAVSRVGDRRWRRSRQVRSYLQGALTVDEQEQLTPAEQQLEFCMLGLRTGEGISLAEYAGRFDRTFDEQYPGVRQQWIGDGLANPGPRLRLTAAGWAKLDLLVAQL